MSLTEHSQYYFFKPYQDELFSSWFIRNALSFGVMPSTLFAKITGSTDNWKADMDVYLPKDIIKLISKSTGVSKKKIYEMTFNGGCSYFYNQSGKTKHVKWVMPIGVRTKNPQYGLQVCPCCLAEDENQAYYRKEWRLGFMTACPNHSVQLIDRCPKCQANINLKKTFKDKDKVIYSPDDITKCHKCGFDFRDSYVCIASNEELTMNLFNINQYRNGYGLVHNLGFQYSHLYFNGIRRLMALLICNKNTTEKLFIHFRNKLGLYHPFHPEMIMKHSEPEFMDIKFRRTGLVILNYLLQDWPNRLAEEFEVAHVTSHKTHSNGFDYSYWIIEPLTKQIFQGRYQLTSEERTSIVDYFYKDLKKQIKPHQAQAYIYKYYGVS